VGRADEAGACYANADGLLGELYGHDEIS